MYAQQKVTLQTMNTYMKVLKVNDDNFNFPEMQDFSSTVCAL